MCYGVLLKEKFNMSMDEITAYLLSGKLDQPDPELDVYKHLKVGLPLPVVDEAQNLNPPEVIHTYKDGATLTDDGKITLPEVGFLSGPLEEKALGLTHLGMPEASTAISEPHDDSSALFAPNPLNEKATAILKAAITEAITEVGLEEFKKTSFFGSNDPVKRSRKMQYDVSDLEKGEHLIYNGILASGRVMASLKGKRYDYKREFQATQVGGSVHITRIK
jgi:hypothetical protein